MSLAEIAYIHRSANLGENQVSEVNYHSAIVSDNNNIHAAEKSILPGNLSEN